MGTGRDVETSAVSSDAVALDGQPGSSLRGMARRARAAATPEPSLDDALALAREVGAEVPVPGRGQSLALWEALATIGAVDLTVARVLEPHLDALAILSEASLSPTSAGSVWGVFAAEGGARLHASLTADSWTLTGQKPWCSLADRVSHALVTAWVDDERRGLFALDLSDPGVQPLDGLPWVARGLSQVPSTGLDLQEVPVIPVGEPGWYLERPGFAWGGIGVAAIWYGGAVALARRMRAASTTREPDQIALAHLGAVDVALARARAVLVDAAKVVDGPPVGSESAGLLALRVRQVVADTAEEVLGRCGHALGPAPLAREEEHARRVADLSLYVRQHHAERDAVALGRATLSADVKDQWSWW